MSEEERVNGTVRWFNAERGFGFCTLDGDSEENDYFIHFSQISMEGYKTLKAGQKISFVLVNEDKGIQAQEVIPE